MTGVAAVAVEEAAVVVLSGGTVAEVVEVPSVAQEPGAPPCRISPGVPNGDNTGSALGHSSVPPSDPYKV